MSNARNLADSARVVLGSLASKSTVGSADITDTVKKQFAKAWVKFDGKTGSTATVIDSFGITSVVRNSTGDYTVTFSTAFANTNFAMVASCKGESSIGIYASQHLTVSPTTTTIRIQTWYGYAAGSLLDSSAISLAFYSN